MNYWIPSYLAWISEFGVPAVKLKIACDWERVRIKTHIYMIGRYEIGKFGVLEVDHILFFSGCLSSWENRERLILRVLLPDVFFRLVVVPHINSRTWLTYGRLSIHKMFRTNPVVLKTSYPYVKILFLARFFLKTRRSSKNLTQSNSKQLKTSTFYPDSFPVARNFEIDRWTPNSLMWPVFEFIRSPGIYSYPACSLYFQVSKSNTFSPSCQHSGGDYRQTSDFF